MLIYFKYFALSSVANERVRRNLKARQLSKMDSSDSDEEDCFLYWNNWLPCNTNQYHSSKSSSTREKPKSFIYRNKNETLTYSIVRDSFRVGNWIPPMNFINVTKYTQKQLKEPDIKKNDNTNNNKKTFYTEAVCVAKTETICNGGVGWSKKINLDWGERVELHDVSRFNDGDMFWGVVNLGLFSQIKLRTNEYGHVCGLAEGTILKQGSSEVSFISVTNTDLLRKILNLSNTQWATLCETLQETKSVLKFDVFQDCDFTRKTSLEKLWFFLCRRRHLFPSQCMLVKLSGAVKCLRKFTIMPKLIVQDVRNMQGQQIY